MASATRSCSSSGRALTWSTIDCVREFVMPSIIRYRRIQRGCRSSDASRDNDGRPAS
jgi:hypothetical protein